MSRVSSCGHRRAGLVGLVENRAETGGGEWLWVKERILQLLAEDGEAPLFVSACVRNQSTFYDRFDAVVLLRAAPETILDANSTLGRPLGEVVSNLVQIAARPS